ncbi:hypothetical protein B0H11DRAFT_2258998 [Mycena galericulata]|nr:hypothetical protein B0H11DRAFT_2258998 [Mycena galericulata]
MSTSIPLERTSGEALEQGAFNQMSTAYETRRMGSGERHVNLDHQVDFDTGENTAVMSYDVVVTRNSWVDAHLASCRAYAAYFKENLPTSDAARWELLRHYEEYLRLVCLMRAQAEVEREIVD